MSVQTSICAALVAALLAPTLTSAQDTDSKLNQIIQNMVTRDDLKDLVTKDEFQSEVNNLRILIADQEAKIQKLRSDLITTDETLNGQMAEQRKIIEVISRNDSQGKPILALNNIMQNSPEFREEMSSAVNNSLAAEGKLIVNNKTSFDRQLRINNRDIHTISANSTREFSVNAGTVTTELIGDETAKNWTIAAPKNEQVIDIVSATDQVVVRRPILSESVIVQRPVYSESVVVERPVVVQRPVVVERPTVYVQRPSVVVQSPVIAAPAPVFMPAPMVAAPTVVYERRGLFGRRLVPSFVY